MGLAPLLKGSIETMNCSYYLTALLALDLTTSVKRDIVQIY